VSTVGASDAAPTVAPPPTEAPGPSVTPPTAVPGSETEAAEAAEATVPLPDPAAEPARPVVHTDDDFVAAEEAAAAAEARGIGGPRLDDAHGDEAFEAVYEAGGGEAEGFEIAQDQLIENATHGDGRGDPIGDAFTPEAESDEQTAVDAEADEERVSELGEDDTDRR
jgi:voltage-gated potassium channel Kch